MSVPSLGALIDHVAQVAPDDDPVGRLSTAAGVATALGEAGDHLVGYHVDQARRGGASWAQIGAALGGVSKQAAQQRFTSRAEDEAIGADRLARWTSRARLVVARAEHEHGDPQVEPVHLLAAVLADDGGLARRALHDSGVRISRARAAVDAALPERPGRTTGRVRWSSSGRKVVGLADRESLRLAHPWVGTEHLLLALLAEPDTDAYVVLTGLGVVHDEVERSVLTAIENLRAARSDTAPS